MTRAEIETLLQAAFEQCRAAGCPLDQAQQQILRQMVQPLLALAATGAGAGNPLDQLMPDQRRLLLSFIAQQQQQGQDWKAQLLNDWFQGRDSGPIQFIRDRYGLQWLGQVQPFHLAAYQEPEAQALKVGDRIEVCNGLWEWVQADGPCSPEWFPCTVVNLYELPEPLPEPFTVQHCTCCIIRFENGTEYEIQGVYEWNRPNWRWAQGQT